MLDDGAKLERTKCWPYPAKCQEVGTLCTEMNPRNENKAPQWSILIEVKCAECHKMTDQRRKMAILVKVLTLKTAWSLCQCDSWNLEQVPGLCSSALAALFLSTA